MDISVIIVSYNTRAMTLACLRALYDRTKTATFEVILIDNASSDGTVDAVREAFPDVRIIANTDNRGFAAANNQGFPLAEGEYLLLLNPDTEIDDGCLDRTLAFARKHADAGAIGIRAWQPDGRQQATLLRFPRLRFLLVRVLVPHRFIARSRLLGHEYYAGKDLDSVQEVEVVCGCFILVPRQVVEQVGDLDEDFFMYGEEVEWCYRISQGGWRILYYPDASMLHYGGASTEKMMGRMSLVLARSQLTALHKIRGPLVALVGNALMFLRDLPRAVAFKLLTLMRVPLDQGLRERLHHSAERCALHARGLLTLDWAATARAGRVRSGATHSPTP